MILKAVTLFLIFMLVLGMFGKLRAPQLPKILRRKSVETASKCKHCNRYIIGKAPCVCQKRP